MAPAGFRSMHPGGAGQPTATPASTSARQAVSGAGSGLFADPPVLASREGATPTPAKSTEASRSGHPDKPGMTQARPSKTSLGSMGPPFSSSGSGSVGLDSPAGIRRNTAQSNQEDGSSPSSAGFMFKGQRRSEVPTTRPG